MAAFVAEAILLDEEEDVVVEGGRQKSSKRSAWEAECMWMYVCEESRDMVDGGGCGSCAVGGYVVGLDSSASRGIGGFCFKDCALLLEFGGIERRSWLGSC